jgi:hypothetical protein
VRALPRSQIRPDPATRLLPHASRVFSPSKKTEKTFATPAEQEAHKALNKQFDEKVKPFRQQIATIEKPVREKLMREKIEFHVNLARKSNGFGELTEAQYREETSKRLHKEVNLQPEEIEAELAADALQKRKDLQKQMEAINAQRPKTAARSDGRDR